MPFPFSLVFRPGTVLAGQLEGSLEELSKTFNTVESAPRFLRSKSRVSWSIACIGRLTSFLNGMDTSRLLEMFSVRQQVEVDASFKIDKESLERWEGLKGSPRDP